MRICDRAVPRRRQLAVALSLLAALLLGRAPPIWAAHSAPVVRVDGGRISGLFAAPGVDAYLGVPYAAAPEGTLRWREPQPVTPWQGIRHATTYGASCMQARQPLGQPAMSEDCLFLNVWAPRQSSLHSGLPVLVYLHGAGFNTGSASQALLSGVALARRGLVVVTMNYRLGVMASLALPQLTAESPHHTSGANLHLDQLAALHWVQRNIRHFGGDPGNVTLMGQSSGSIDVSILQASPLSRGLFNKVMGLSGAGVLHGGGMAGLDAGSGRAAGPAGGGCRRDAFPR